MKEKGFTLIELLAVIVILAIIALIATPIILNIINDSRDESKLISAGHYLDGVELALAKSKEEIPDNTYNIMSNGNLCIGEYSDDECSGKILEVKMDGEYPTSGTITISNGIITNGTSLKYADYTVSMSEDNQLVLGEGGLSDDLNSQIPVKQVFKPQFYSLSTGKIGDDLPEDAVENSLDLGNGYNTVYLGLDVDSDNKVSAAYACFMLDDIEYCLKGNDEQAYIENKQILMDLFGDTDAECTFEDPISRCIQYYDYYVGKGGAAGVSSSYEGCSVTGYGDFSC